MRLKCPSKILRVGRREAAARLADVAQPRLVALPEPQGRDLPAGRRMETPDEEPALLFAFDLDPRLAAAGAIRRIGALRDDPLHAHRASLREHRRAVRFEMLAVEDRPGHTFEEVRQQALAFNEGHGS